MENCDALTLDEDCDGEVNEAGPDCICGDGYVSSGEDCDDRNTMDGDACPASCLRRVTRIQRGLEWTCGRLDDGHIKCWGLNGDGQLGLGDTQNRGDGPNEMGANLPAINFGTGKTAVTFAVGDYHICVLLNDGSVKCWGRNAEGQLGLGDNQNRGDGPNEMGDNLPAVNLGTGETAVAIAAGARHNCAILNDGSVKCWGWNSEWDTEGGQLGLGDSQNRGDGPNEMGDNLPAVDLGTGKTAVAIAAGILHTCALLNDGSLKCWGDNDGFGDNDEGTLGLGDSQNRGDGPNEMGDNLPAVNLGTGKTAVAIAPGLHTCALLNDGSVKCWGINLWGQLGLGDTQDRGDALNEMGDNLPAVDLGTGKIALAVSAAYQHSCARLNDGSLKCWGSNADGQLGQGHTQHRGDGPNEMGNNLPAIDLGTVGMISAIDAEHGAICALFSDGRVKCWGNNKFGQLGLGDLNNRGDNPGEMGDNLPFVMLW